MRAELKKIAIFTLFLTLYLLSTFEIMAFAAEFPDVKRTHKNYTAVTNLVDLGVIAGYDDGYFRPEREITRTEFCALMSRTLGYDKESYTLKKLPFTDVKAGYWGEAYISFCYEKGLINGMGNGEFWPAEKVTLEQAIKMAVCAIDKGDEAALIEGSKWYSGYVEVAGDCNLLYKISPSLGKAALRGDIAQLVYNMIESGFLKDESDEEDNKNQPDTSSSDDKTEEETEVNTIPPEILEAYRKKDFSQVKTILIDAGHNYSGKDIGAENTELNLNEEKITWQIADKLRDMLETMGYTVVMTRDKVTDSIANTSVVESLQARVDLAHESLSDLFISIHCNAGGGSGTEVYSFKTGGYAGRLAKLVQKNITQDTKLYDRGTKTAKFFVIQNTLMPAILIETGFIDNEDDAEIISSANGQKAIAKAIANAIVQYDKEEIIEARSDEEGAKND